MKDFIKAINVRKVVELMMECIKQRRAVLGSRWQRRGWNRKARSSQDYVLSKVKK